MTSQAIHIIPSLSVRLAGSDLSSAEIVGCRVSQTSRLPDQIELTFADAAPRAARPRADLEVRLDSQGLLFAGTITAVAHTLGADGAAFVRIRGYDRLQTLRASTAVQSWQGVTLQDIAQRFAERLGLTVRRAHGAETDRARMQHIIQRGQSDLEFLAVLAARSGLGFRLLGSELEFYSTDRGAGTPIELKWGESLREAVVDDNLEAAARPVHVGSQDLAGVTSHTETAASGSGPARNLLGIAELTPLDADLLAHAEVARWAADATRVRGVADGDLRLRPGAVVTVRGPGLPDRNVVLTRAEHVLDDTTGFTTSFDSEPIEAPAPAGSTTTASLATVSVVDDEGGTGRVKVTLDAYDGIETALLPVLTAAAGIGGLVALPEVGSRVIVLSDALDLSQGVVLGGLFPERLPDAARAGGRTHSSVWITPAGQRIEMDDHDRTLVLTDTSGSRLEFAPGVVRLHAAGDLELAAPGRGVRITASSVDFMRG